LRALSFGRLNQLLLCRKLLLGLQCGRFSSGCLTSLSLAHLSLPLSHPSAWPSSSSR
jgi:hypothetical protein